MINHNLELLFLLREELYGETEVARNIHSWEAWEELTEFFDNTLTKVLMEDKTSRAFIVIESDPWFGFFRETLTLLGKDFNEKIILCNELPGYMEDAQPFHFDPCIYWDRMPAVSRQFQTTSIDIRELSEQLKRNPLSVREISQQYGISTHAASEALAAVKKDFPSAFEPDPRIPRPKKDWNHNQITTLQDLWDTAPDPASVFKEGKHDDWLDGFLPTPNVSLLSKVKKRFKL